jgi:hypothetical protein
MAMNCPGPEQAAAYADGRLDAAEAARYLEHCSECDECRRTLAILSQPRESVGVPPDVEARALAALGRNLNADRDRERSATRPIRRITAPPAAVLRPQKSTVGFVIAAAIFVGFVGLFLMTMQPTPRAPEAPREIVVIREMPVAPQPKPEVEAPTVPEVQKPEPPKRAPKPEVVSTPRPPAPPQRIDDLRPVEFFAEPVIRKAPKPEEIKPEELKPEEPPRNPSHTVVARVLTELQITDVTGSLFVQRKGAKAKERLGVVARLSEGDVVIAEKSASFQVDGKHPVVLTENTQVSMAYVAQEQAPWLKLLSGEALVDSTGSARWVVTDGVIAVAVKPARARFTAARGDARLALSSLSEPLYVQPDGGQVLAIHIGQELQVGKSVAEVRTLDAGVAAKKIAAFDAARPRQRTIFYTSCDAADQKREHFFVQEGVWWRTDGLYSRERNDRTAAASIGPNPRFNWRNTLVMRFRFTTNCKAVEAQFRCDEKKYTLFKSIAVDRKKADQWIVAEVPLEIAPAGQVQNWAFRRDDGQLVLTVTPGDFFDAIRFVVKPGDVYGDMKPYVLIDDIQVFEKE